VRQPGAEGDRLVAHLVPAGGTRPSAEEIRGALREHLPGYMSPSAIVWHDSLPLTRNGKVDRARLTAMAPRAAPGAPAAGETGELQASPGGATHRGMSDEEAKISDMQRKVAELWAPVLRVPAADIGPGTDFYDLGGDSLAAARIFTAVRKQFGIGITLDQLHQVRTTAQMAGFLTAAGAT
jgi:acyl carrier protein